MSRTIKGSKASGYDYWSKRAYSCCVPGRFSKQITNGIERMRNRKAIKELIEE